MEKEKMEEKKIRFLPPTTKQKSAEVDYRPKCKS